MTASSKAVIGAGSTGLRIPTPLHFTLSPDLRAQVEQQLATARYEGIAARDATSRIYQTAAACDQAALTPAQTLDIRSLEASRRAAHLRTRALSAILDLDSEGLPLLVGSFG